MPPLSHSLVPEPHSCILPPPRMGPWFQRLVSFIKVYFLGTNSSTWVFCFNFVRANNLVCPSSPGSPQPPKIPSFLLLVCGDPFLLLLVALSFVPRGMTPLDNLPRPQSSPGPVFVHFLPPKIAPFSPHTAFSPPIAHNRPFLLFFFFYASLYSKESYPSPPEPLPATSSPLFVVFKFSTQPCRPLPATVVFLGPPPQPLLFSPLYPFLIC